MGSQLYILAYTLPYRVTSTYTFKGWAEQENYEEGDKLYQAGEEVVLTWSEDYGSVENPVSKTLYAVWEEDGSTAAIGIVIQHIVSVDSDSEHIIVAIPRYNPVSKTLYAVWEEDGSAPNAPDAPKREDLYGIPVIPNTSL